MSGTGLSIVVPAYNEAESIGPVLPGKRWRGA